MVTLTMSSLVAVREERPARALVWQPLCAKTLQPQFAVQQQSQQQQQLTE